MSIEYTYNANVGDNGLITLIAVSPAPTPVSGKVIQLPYNSSDDYQLTINAPSGKPWDSAAFWAPNPASPAQGTNFVAAKVSGGNGPSTTTDLYNLNNVKLTFVSLNGSSLVIKNRNRNTASNSVYVGLRFVFKNNSTGLLYSSEDPQIEDLKNPGQ